MRESMVMDVRVVSENYVAKLQCCFRSSNSYSLRLVQSIHGNMTTSGLKPRKFIFNLLISLYCKSNYLGYARHVFDGIPDPDIVSRTALISAYSASGNLTNARQIFDETPNHIRDSVFYNAMISASYNNNDPSASIELFREMRRHRVHPDALTFITTLTALTDITLQHHFRLIHQIHCTVVKFGTAFHTKVSNALVSVYVKCASFPVEEARRVFDEIPLRDETTWATMVAGYASRDQFDAATELLRRMNADFRDPWNAIISGYVRQGRHSEALRVFKEMCSNGVSRDEFTCSSALAACSNAGFFELGKQLHANILRTNSANLSLFVNNSLLTLYAGSGSLDEARVIFDRMRSRDGVSWTVILSGYVDGNRMDEAKSFFMEIPEKNGRTWTVIISGLAQNGDAEEAIKLFDQMRLEGVETCGYVFSGEITACAVLGALKTGCQFHALAIQTGNDSGISVRNALITMYARCGALESAQNVFLAMPYKDSVSWNAMIAAFAQHGKGTESIQLFEKMLKEDIQPTKTTFLTILSACSHAGLVEEGQRHFDSMLYKYGITPDEEHYAGMIDLLCRAGKFAEAKSVMKSMPFEPGTQTWESLLAGSWIHKRIDWCVEAADKLIELKPEQDTTYVMLSNVYASMGKWDEVAKVRKYMRGKGVKKEPGCSWVEVENKVHVFLVNDKTHDEIEAVYEYLHMLVSEMKKLGYVAETKYMDGEKKEYALSTTHSEKLAVAFGVMKLPSGAIIRVFKNLRICGDCHNAIKIMSRVVCREIIVRDGRRFHHFKDGHCSCRDFW